MEEFTGDDGFLVAGLARKLRRWFAWLARQFTRRDKGPAADRRPTHPSASAD
jgi:hypothetical protein